MFWPTEEKYGWTSPPSLKHILQLKHEVKGPPLKVKAHASTAQSLQDQGVIHLQDLGFDRKFYKDKGMRTIMICVKTGMPSITPGVFPEAVSLGIKDEMMSYLVLESEEDDFRLVCVGTDKNTYYMAFAKGRRAAYFYTDYPSYHGRHAIRGLLHTSLLKGPKAFDRHNELLPGFFKRTLFAVYTKITALRLTGSTVKGREQGREFLVKVYLKPGKPEASMISVDGWCFDFDLDEYPKMQLLIVDRFYHMNSPSQRRARQERRQEAREKRVAEQGKEVAL